MQMPASPLSTSITTAYTVSRASDGLGSPASIIETINDSSMTVTASVSTKVPYGSPSQCATSSAWCTATSTAATSATASPTPAAQWPFLPTASAPNSATSGTSQ